MYCWHPSCHFICHIIFTRREPYRCEEWACSQQASTAATPQTLRGTWLAWQKWRSKVSCCPSVCLSRCLSVCSSSLWCLCAWLDGSHRNLHFSHVSSSCIIWQSGNRNSNWVKLLLYPCVDNIDIMIWDKISYGILVALLYCDKALCFAQFKGSLLEIWQFCELVRLL